MTVASGTRGASSASGRCSGYSAAPSPTTTAPSAWSLSPAAGPTSGPATSSTTGVVCGPSCATTR